jgi:LmbE family N-acetylglucosaminyl deacetylase
MLEMVFGESLRPRTLLCIGAHCDDIEIGCGGAVQTLIARNPELDVRWVIFGSDAERGPESAAAAARLAKGARSFELVEHRFRNSYMPYAGPEVKEAFDALRRSIEPDLIFTHTRDDLHQDHRLLSELTLNTFRNHLILEYEIPKYDGDLGRPNLYVPVSRAVAEAKIRCLMECFASQRSRSWFTEETFLALMRIRGVECASPSGLAEAFHARKLVAARL